MSDDQLKEFALCQIVQFLQNNGKSLKDYPSMPFPDEVHETETFNNLILEELAYNRIALAN